MEVKRALAWFVSQFVVLKCFPVPVAGHASVVVHRFAVFALAAEVAVFLPQ